jgi:microcystin-dependent protein
MSEPFLGEIRLLPFTFAPAGWALCNGQLLPIAQNTALFSLLGTTYGGNGSTTFALPNLQGAAPMGFGQGPGLSPHDLGETGGSNTVTLLASEMPAHNHALGVSSAAGTSTTATQVPPFAAIGVPPTNAFGPTYNMAPMGGLVGSGLPHENRQPYLALNFCIAMQGIFPARS